MFASQASSTIIPADLFIDFRDNPWNLANSQASYLVNYSFGNVTAKALPAEKTLWQDSTDGLGSVLANLMKLIILSS